MPSSKHGPEDDWAKTVRRAQAALEKGDLKVAEKSFRELLVLDPTCTDAADNLGNLLLRQRRTGEALACFQATADGNPDSPRALNNLGAALMACGNRSADAVTCFERAVSLAPDYLAAYRNLALVLNDLARLKETIRILQRVLTLDPGNLDALNDLGIVYERSLLYKDAKFCFEKVVQSKPDHHQALNNLAKVAQAQCLIDESVGWLRKAIEVKPDYAVGHSNLLLTLHYQRVLDPERLSLEHREWARRHAPPHLARSVHPNRPDPDRPLRVGYLTPDIRAHPVAYFLEAILDAHDPKRVEPYAYAQVTKPDETTSRMKAKFNVYRSTVGHSDQDVAAMILEDQIDILVDLAGHTAENRLMVMARRPAPIQVTYLGYPDTTGMSAMDYRMTDALADPEGQDLFCAEKLVRLPHCFLCYHPPEDAPPVMPPPVLVSGGVTFGSFNSLHKVNEDVVRLWARLLQRVPGSKLLLKSMAFQDSGIRDRYLELFAGNGVEPDRLTMASWEPGVKGHLALYAEVDIGLDPFPYHGTTTTCEALWMGVPVVTRRGVVHVSRVGCSLLHQVGLDSLVARDEEEYLNIAAGLAADPGRLAILRSELRDRMRQSPLCGKDVFTRNLEQAYRAMWHTWCQAQGGRSTVGDPDTAVMPAEQKASTSSDAATVGSEPIHDRSVGLPAPTSLTGVRAEAKEPRGVVEEAWLADELNRAGRRSKAFEHANAGWRLVKNGRFTKGAPDSLLESWQSRTIEGVLLRQCISFGFSSSYFGTERSKEWFMAWARLEPDHPEPLLRLGLLWALESALANSPVPSPALQALKHAAQLMQDERSAKALALCSGPLAELNLPYDGGHICVRPDIRDLTTYVLLEQGDWFDEDLDLLRTLAKPGMSMLDLGAHVGVYSFSVAQRVGPQGRVASVEPDPRACELMARTAEPFPHWAVCGGEPCRRVSVDTLAKQLGGEAFDLVRIDTERFPIDHLDGARELLGAHSPVVFYTVRQGSGVNTALVDAFREAGYVSSVYIPGQKLLKPIDANSELDHLVLNAVALKPDRMRGLIEELGR